MAIDKEKYIRKYIDEGLENISLVETLIFDIKDGVSVEDDLATLLRALHTLKGSSRMLEFKRIEELTHSLESVFVAFREQRIGLSEKALKLILSSLDLLKSGFDAVKNTKDDTVDIQENTENLSLLAANEDFLLPKKNESQGKDLNFLTLETADASKKNESENIEAKLNKETKKETKSESIRLSIEKIDGIIKSIASLQSLEISAKSISQNSASLNSMIKEYSNILKEYRKKEPALVANFRKLERQSERLYSSLRNYVIDAGNHIRGAYDSVISLRTLPLSTIFDSYPRYVYQLADELGKKVHLTIEGKENEIDKNIIESLSEVFLHMIRNAIDHGIEMPQERIASGKNETGNISIICSRESGNMKIVICDDGLGIDHEKIRQKAVREGFVTEAAAASLSREELTNFIFQSGFSTSGKVSSVSGRGVGMDVVRDSIEALKGSVLVDSVFGKGTTFTIMVPLSIAALMGFPVECGGMKFIVPANFVDTIMLVDREDIITVVDRPEIKYNDRIVKLYYLSQILHIKTGIVHVSDVIFVVMIRSYEDIAALAVDNIDSMRSVILKTMPAFMDNIPVFSGIVLNEDYEMVSVLHIPTVIKMAKRIKTIDIKKHNIESEKLRKSVLVVDDSLPIREIESEILKSEGYMTDMAADGAQALKAAKSKHYDLICTDLNMPVMDGFMLIENLKKNEELSSIPVIVISSIADEEEKKRAYQLGASKYIIKNSFNNHNLLDAVNDLIGGTQ
ncbi:MAG: response regulator [Treponema sp.]|jgi:chemotaxis protein histidine kinase CheA/CheY-like chemotaxis protein|nr:response regulator [Treponema sp.]